MLELLQFSCCIWLSASYYLSSSCCRVSCCSDQADAAIKPLTLVDMSTQMCKVRASKSWCETMGRESLKLFQGEVSGLIHTLLVCLTARCVFGIVPRLRQWQCCRCLRDWSSQHLPGLVRVVLLCPSLHLRRCLAPRVKRLQSGKVQLAPGGE